MMKFIKWGALIIAILALIGALYLKLILGPKTDADMNAVIDHAPYAISEAAQNFHNTLTVADLHTDTLLWARDPRKRYDYGHVDLPRLAEGNVKFQLFSAVTKSPRGLNFDQNDGTGPDNIALLAKAQFWPPRTWDSLYERAAYQAERLTKLEQQGHVLIARDRSSFEAAINSDKLVTILLTEGAHPLEGDIGNIKRLYARGYRVMGLQHFFDNELGGSMHGITKAGLTPFGFEAVKAMEDMGIIIDIAHSSEQSVRDAMKVTSSPMILSHGGILSACPKTANRNLPDDILVEIAKRGGLIGIGYFSGVICDIQPRGIADAIIYGVDLLGEDHVALGSDFDGTVTTTLDTSELAAITQALMDKGMEKPVIAKVMGGNAVRFFGENLPQ